MNEDFFTIKNLLTIISAPLTFLLGLAGWHYKGILTYIDEIDKKVDKLEIIAHEHNVHVSHFHETNRKIENKLDYLLKKIDDLK